VVICDFNIFDTSFCPSEADAPLPVYSDAVLSGSIPLERFQPIDYRAVSSGLQDLPQFQAVAVSGAQY